jgi:acyl-CoA synthetase (AMP-forming)/AMP-acid ligase II
VLRRLLIFYLKCIKKINAPSGIIGFSCQKYTNQTFLIHPETKTTLTFNQWKERTQRLAIFLNGAGLHNGDVLAFSAPNCLEYFEMRCASHLSGIVFLGLPAHLNQEDIAYFLNKTQAKALFYRRTQNNLDIDALRQITQASHFFNLDGPAYKEIFQESAIIRPPAGRAGNTPSDTATFNLSSATTGKTPKIIQLTNKNWTESVYNYIRNSDVQPNKKIVFLCAVSFLSAGSTTFLPSILAGAAQVIINEDFTPESLVNYITQYKANYLYITPSRLLELLEYCKANDRHLDPLENIITGTERIPAIKLKEAVDFFGPIITVGYGMAEALPPLAMLSPQDYANKDSSLNIHRLDSAGKIAKGVAVKILSDGRIAVKSNTVSCGYLDNPEENVKCFKDEWFHTNDYGFIDKEGFLHILGRKEEVLTQAPRLIFAKEVEDKIYELPFIKRCSGIARGGRVFVFVSLREKIVPQEAGKKILECLKNSNLMEFLTINDIIIKESLPINFAGKLDRRSM